MIFFSQNDNRWRNKYLGKSRAKMGAYGCTTTDVSILGTWFGEVIPPGELADRLEYTYGNLDDRKNGLLIWPSIGKVYKRMKFKWRFKGFDKALIDQALLKNPDTVVLLNVDHGYHWVAALGKTFGQYKCRDPYPYPSKTRLYKASDIVGGAILERKI